MIEDQEAITDESSDTSIVLIIIIIVIVLILTSVAIFLALRLRKKNKERAKEEGTQLETLPQTERNTVPTATAIEEKFNQV